MNQWQGLPRSGLALLLACPFFLCEPTQAVENMVFRGGLVNAPCTLRPGDEAIALEFRTVIDKFLYSDTRTPSQPFSLHLEDCDVAVATGVKVTFVGTESLPLPGLLALDASSVARGVAIGIETSAGQPLALNIKSAAIPLTPGDMTLAFQAYVQAEPTAKASKGIVRGPFTATATFALEYQ